MTYRILDTHTRGDTYVRTAPLSSGYTAASFVAMAFTVRSGPPASSVTSDAEALAKATLAGGGVQIVGSDVTVTIADTVTRSWPARQLLCDLEGVLVNGHRITLALGTIDVFPDVTRG